MARWLGSLLQLLVYTGEEGGRSNMEHYCSCVCFLVQAVVGSSFIPCFSGYIPPVFRGKVSTVVDVVQLFLLVLHSYSYCACWLCQFCDLVDWLVVVMK